MGCGVVERDLEMAQPTKKECYMTVNFNCTNGNCPVSAILTLPIMIADRLKHCTQLATSLN